MLASVTLRSVDGNVKNEKQVRVATGDDVASIDGQPFDAVDMTITDMACVADVDLAIRTLSKIKMELVETGEHKPLTPDGQPQEE